jgi:hypothetical protein
MEDEQKYYSPRASLALVAQRFKAMNIWTLVQQSVVIEQKTVKYDPISKLLDSLILIMAGGRGVVEINTRVRNDKGLQRAFGRSECAEQSTVSKTLSACTSQNVVQMRSVNRQMLELHGCVMEHLNDEWLGLDVDMLGMVSGRHSEGATKGYFSGGRDQRGRQLGRVLATQYEEVIVERLYEGKHQLEHSLPELIAAAEAVLNVNGSQRLKNRVIRMDGGGGTESNINFLFEHDYHVLTKLHSWNRSAKLAASVQTWQTDPKCQSRDAGWVTLPHQFIRATRQLALRTISAKGKVHYDVLVSSLSDQQLCACFNLDATLGTPWPLLFAYDLRGGGLETQNRSDRQGLALGHRNKRSFAAQEMLVLLGQLAHNILIWIRNDLARVDPRFAHYGLKRLVRDVLTIDGEIFFDQNHTFLRVELNPLHPMSAAVLAAFQPTYVQNVAHFAQN